MFLSIYFIKMVSPIMQKISGSKYPSIQKKVEKKRGSKCPSTGGKMMQKMRGSKHPSIWGKKRYTKLVGQCALVPAIMIFVNIVFYFIILYPRGGRAVCLQFRSLTTSSISHGSRYCLLVRKV